MTDPGSVADLEHTPYESVSAVSFHTDRKGNVSGRFRGAVVLRDRSSEEIIRPGETWFCSLRLNPISLGNYFARAIRKVDASSPSRSVPMRRRSPMRATTFRLST